MPPGQLFVIITGSFIDIASNKAFGAPSNLEDKTNNVDFLYQEYGFTNPLKEILFFKLSILTNFFKFFSSGPFPIITNFHLL